MVSVDDKHTSGDIAQLERRASSFQDEKDHQNYDRMDAEVARYAGDVIEISEEESKQLRRKIDKRVLLIMIATYFLQALDKGTLSFAAIMGIRKDTNLVGQQVLILFLSIPSNQKFIHNPACS